MADAVGILGTLRILVDADAKKAQSTLTTLPGMAKVAGTAIAAGFGIAAAGALEMEDRAAKFQAATGASLAEAQHFTEVLNASAGRSLVPMDALAEAMTLIRTDLGLTGDAADVAAGDFERWMRATGQGAEAVGAFDDILDSWNLTADETTTIMDTLLAGQHEYGGVLSESMDILTKLAPALQAANMEWQDGAEFINLFNAAGVDANAMVAAMSKALSKVESPQELEALLRAISAIEDPFLRAQKASELFGAKAGPKLAQALQASNGDLSQFGFTVDEVAGTVDEAADALDSTLTARIKLITNQALSLLRGFGMEVGPVLTAAFSAVSLGKMLGLDKVIGPVFAKAGTAAGAIFAKAMAAATALIDWGVGLAKVGWAKLGALYGGKFGVAFRIAAVAAAALIWVEVINQYNAFLATVKAKNDEIAAEAANAIAGGVDMVLSKLEDRAAAMRNANPLQRAIQDSFQQEQMLTEMADFGRALSSQANLTGDQIARGLSALDAAIVEAVARGNTSIAASLERAKADLEQRWTSLAPSDRASKATAAQVQAFTSNVSTAVETSTSIAGSWGASLAKAGQSFHGALSGPIREEGDDAVRAVMASFGDIKAALSNPPKFISNEQREKNMLGRIDKLRRRSRLAAEAGDTRASRHYALLQESQEDRHRRFLAATEGGTEDTSDKVAKHWKASGGKVGKTWQGTAKAAGKATGKAKADSKGATSSIASQHAAMASAAARSWANVSSAAARAMSSARLSVAAGMSSIRTIIALGLANIDATSGGLSVGKTFANGIRLAIPTAVAAAMQMAAAVKKVLGASMPTEGPLVHVDEGGRSVGQAWSRGLDEGLGKDIGARIAGGIAPRPKLAAMAAGARGGGGNIIHYHIGTLIANDEGIDELDRRTENRRRLRRRGHDPVND